MMKGGAPNAGQAPRSIPPPACRPALAGLDAIVNGGYFLGSRTLFSSCR